MLNANCGCSPEQVDMMFKRAEQYIDEQITDRTYEMARYWVDLYPVKPFPDGVGLVLDKMRFFGDIGPQYDGYDGWRKVQITRRAAEAALSGENDGCGYKWEDVGHGMETISYDLMQRDLRTKPICVKDIRTFWQYREVQNLIFQNLTNISANMREQLNRNATMGFAVKYIALPGLPTNQFDPHQLPVIPSGVEVGKLSYLLLLQLYHPLAQEAGQYALSNLNGAPAFGLVGHPETLHDMYYTDTNVRTDIRECRGESGNACDLIKRYNFLEAIGPFILMPDLNAPRYNRDANGNLSRVFPYDREVPIEIGTRPMSNPEYHTAEFEMCLILTRDLFALRTRRPLTSVGGETNFDSEVPMFQWKWHNPDRCEDPYRRTGRYVTTGEIGVEPGDFTSIAAVLVKRKPNYAGIEFWPAQVCPPEPNSCENELPAGACPCPLVIGICATIEDDELVLQFDRPTGAVAQDLIELETPNGSFVTATVVSANTTGDKLQVQFAAAVEAVPGMFVGLRCLDVSFCSAKVLKTETCGILAQTPTITLTLDRLLKVQTAVETPTVTLIMCDGTQLSADVTAVNLGAIEYTVNVTWANYCAGQGVCSVCVPTATDGSCPACDADVFEECVADSV
jgi:hypothetical protein